MIIMVKKRKEKLDEVKDMLNGLKLLVHADPYNSEEHTLFYRPESGSVIKIYGEDGSLKRFDLIDCQLVSLSPNGLLIQHKYKLYPIELFSINVIKIL